MKIKTIISLASLCLIVVVVSILWFAACASGSGSRGQRGLTVEDLPNIDADIEVFPQMGHTNMVWSLNFNPNGTLLLSASSDKTIKIFDIATGRELRILRGHLKELRSASFSPDGTRIVSSSISDSENGNNIKIWDVSTGTELISFTNDYLSPKAVFSPDGVYIAVTGGSGRGSSPLVFYDAETGEKKYSFGENINSIAFSSDGKIIATGDYISYPFDKPGEIKLWDISTGALIKTLSGHGNSTINAIAYSPDGRRLVSCAGDSTIKIWDIESGMAIYTGTIGPSVDFLTFTPDGTKIMHGSTHEGCIIRDAVNGRVLKTFLNDFSSSAAALSSDGKQFACYGQAEKRSTSELFMPNDDNPHIVLLDAVTGNEIGTFSNRTVEKSGSIAFSRDGMFFASCSLDRIELWNVKTGRIIQNFSVYPETAMFVDISPDGKQLLSGSIAIYRAGAGKRPTDYFIRQWDIATSREIRKFQHFDDNAGGSVSWSVVFNNDGQYILSMRDSSIILFDTNTGQEVQRFLHPYLGVASISNYNRFSAVALSHDGNWLTSGTAGGEIYLWNVITGERRGIEVRLNGRNIGCQFFSILRGRIDNLAFTPDDNKIIYSAFISFPVVSGRVGLLTRTNRVEEVISISANIAAVSPNGKYIVYGSATNSVGIWDTEKKQEILNFPESIASIVFTPDSKRVLINSANDNTSRLFDASTGKEIVQFLSFSGSDTQLAAASRGLTVETETTATTIEGEWLSITPDGYYQASPRGDRYLNVRVNNTVSGIDAYRSIFYNPDVVQARLQGLPDPASKSNVTIQQAAAFIPPEVTIQSPTNFTTTNTATANLSVAITSTTQPIRNIKILVNGRLIGKDELTSVTGTGLQAERASLTVTGNQKTVNFTLPLELEPGNNRIEVVAFNGYSENRRYVDVTRNAPAGERSTLPNLWIAAVGVNGYDNAGPRLGGLTNLNFAVADAKGLIDSLKAQEGRRYAKVNAMLIADGERLVPTTENIRQGFKFLEGADPRRDVVVLFLAGHGISGQGGLFYFLPKDAAMSADKVVDASRAISGDEIMGVLDAPGNRLVFIDACQSGGVDNDRMVRSLMDTNAFVFAASRGNELSYEDARLGHGYFTYSIMSALGGAPAALAQGNVSVLSMSGFVKDDVPKRTNGRQNPSAYSLGFYDFPVAVIRE